ncbi:hypothetical protein CPCC7001_1790 [Cyanobium sp. PCC 7001]|nr:hypothetical protein CPCC7001_1790 [Cyanobium sp. PCC 7001]
MVGVRNGWAQRRNGRALRKDRFPSWPKTLPNGLSVVSDHN